jgi:hypothetical protein
MQTYLQLDNKEPELDSKQSEIGKFQITEKQIVQKHYQYYSFGEFNFFVWFVQKIISFL